MGPSTGGATRERLRQAVRAKHPAAGLDPASTGEAAALRDLQERIAAARRKPPAPPRLHQGRKLEPGAQLAGLDLRKVAWQGVDLRGANLRGADLRGAWLVDARLDGADLTGALLDHAVLDGASLAGAKLFDSSTVDAVNLDAGPMLAHPFFAPQSEEPVGQIRFLRLDARDERVLDGPRCPVASPDGRLYWIGGAEANLNAIFRHGARFELPHPAIRGAGARNSLLYALVKDRQDIIWFFGDQVAGNIQAREQAAIRSNHGLCVNHVGCSIPYAPAAVLPAPDSGVDLCFRPFIARCTWNGSGGAITSTPAPEGATFLASCWNRPGTLRVVALEGVAGVRVEHPGSGRSWPVPLPPGTRVQAMAAGPGETVWVGLAGAETLLALGDQPDEVRLFRPARASVTRATPAPLLRIHGLALGPDGNMWFTAPSTQRIGCCAPDGMIREHGLKSDELPLEIVPAEDGTLLFTLAGLNRIGSIRAAPRPAPAGATDGSAEPKATPAAVPAGAGAAPPAQTRASKRERLKLRQQQAEQDRTLASQPLPEEAPGRAAPWVPMDLNELTARLAGKPAARDQPSPGRAGAPQPCPPSAAAPARLESKQDAAWDPADDLYDRHVTLPKGRLEHILRDHFGSGADGRSLFRREHQGPGPLEALLARGLAAAGGLGQSFDRRGRRYTYCPMPAVGDTWTGSHWEETDCFVIITVDHWNRAEGITEHVVLSAYPCARDY
jgi:hypothetical protein